MATRALIGYLDTDGDTKLTSTYNHYDGYPSNLGIGLETFYNNDTKAEEVSNRGYISFLDGETGEISSANTQTAQITQLPDNFNDAMMEIAAKVDSVGGDYGYIWDNENEEWITIKNDGIRNMTQNLEMELAHLKGKFAMMPERPDQIMNETYKNATNNELASYIGTLSNQIGVEKDLKKIAMLKQDLEDVKNELKKRKSMNESEENKYFVNRMKHRAGIIK